LSNYIHVGIDGDVADGGNIKLHRFISSGTTKFNENIFPYTGKKSLFVFESERRDSPDISAGWK